MNNKFEYIKPIPCPEDLAEYEPCFNVQKLCYCENNGTLYACDGKQWFEFFDKFKTLTGYGNRTFWTYDKVPDERLVNWLKS